MTSMGSNDKLQRDKGAYMESSLSHLVASGISATASRIDDSIVNVDTLFTAPVIYYPDLLIEYRMRFSNLQMWNRYASCMGRLSTAVIKRVGHNAVMTLITKL